MAETRRRERSRWDWSFRVTGASSREGRKLGSVMVEMAVAGLGAPDLVWLESEWGIVGDGKKLSEEEEGWVGGDVFFQP